MPLLDEIRKINEAGDNETSFANRLARRLTEDNIHELVLIIQSNNVDDIRGAAVVLTSNELVRMFDDPALTWLVLDAMISALDRTDGYHHNDLGVAINEIALISYPHDHSEEFKTRLGVIIAHNTSAKGILEEALSWEEIMPY